MSVKKKVLNVVIDKASLKELGDCVTMLPAKHDALDDIKLHLMTKNLGVVFDVRYSTEDVGLMGRKYAYPHSSSKPLLIESRSQISRKYSRQEVIELFASNLRSDRFKNPEFHVHFDMWGWRDSRRHFHKGVPKFLEKELRGIVHMDSFNPFYSVLTNEGEMRASEAYRETPYLFTSGLTCESLEVKPEEARRARIGFEVLNRKLSKIEEKYGVELVGYTELELISMVVKLSDKPFDPQIFRQYYTSTQNGFQSIVSLQSGDIKSGFKNCEFHFKLGKGYEPEMLKGLINLGLINAAMPPGEDGKFTPYFTMQGRSIEVRDQLASYIGLLSRTIGGFGEGAQIQLETIVGHKFFGQDFASDKHLPRIVTGLEVDKTAPNSRVLENAINNPAWLQGVLLGAGHTISEMTKATNINRSYREALDSLRKKPPTRAEVVEVLAKLSAWSDNPEVPVKSSVLSR